MFMHFYRTEDKYSVMILYCLIVQLINIFIASKCNYESYATQWVIVYM